MLYNCFSCKILNSSCAYKPFIRSTLLHCFSRNCFPVECRLQLLEVITASLLHHSWLYSSNSSTPHSAVSFVEPLLVVQWPRLSKL